MKIIKIVDKHKLLKCGIINQKDEESRTNAFTIKQYL